MKPETLFTPDLSPAFNAPPPAFEQGIAKTLETLQKQKAAPVMKKKLSAALIAAIVLLVALMGVVYAMSLSPTADMFGLFYGEEKRQTLLAGDNALINQSITLGDIAYTVDELIYKDGVIYGTATIKPKEGANVILMSEQCSVFDPAGYNVHWGDDPAPAGTKSYAELALEQDAKIILAKLLPNDLKINGKILENGDLGYFPTVRPDNSIHYTFELHSATEYEGEGIPKAPAYQLEMHAANWEVTQEDVWLREEPNDTWLTKYDWLIDFTPEPSK